ncbi:MAG: hypothetical protein NXI07_13230, partial [bacterium]|nr:hypothetical protein [bacterium]
MHISSEAFLPKDGWLEAGWALWEKVSLEHNYFLGTPAPGLEGMQLLEAKYSDGVAISRALLARALGAAGRPLIRESTATGFWTEHSARATFTSWAGSLEQFPADWIDLIGQWKPSQSAEYVRTLRARIVKLQKAVTCKVREGDLEADPSDEDALMEDLRQFLVDHGISEADAKMQLVEFRDPTGGERTEVATYRGDTASEPVEREPDEDEETESVEGPGTPIPENVAAEMEGPEIFDAEGTNSQGGLCVVSIGRSGFRRSQRTGECRYLPGVGYAKFEFLGHERPGQESFQDLCRRCFG